MVNNRKNVSQHASAPPTGVERRIQSGAAAPLYDRADVLRLLGKHAIVAFTQKCTKDVQKYGLDDQQLSDLVKDAVIQGVYKGSEWCEKNPDGPWAACDVYVLSRPEWNKYAHKDILQEYYVKLAINKLGKVILLVSMHQ